MNGIVGLVPCAGRSVRMGFPKALLDADGAPFLARAVGVLGRGGCGSVVAVVRRDDAAAALVGEAAGARVIVNPDPDDGGPISSIRAALATLSRRAEAILLLPVDHPRVRPATVAEVIQLFRRSRTPVVVPRFGGRRGHPVLLGRSVFDELLDPALEGGARTVVRRDPERVLEVDTDDPGVVDDLDTPDAYRSAFPRSPLPGGEV